MPTSGEPDGQAVRHFLRLPEGKAIERWIELWVAGNAKGSSCLLQEARRLMLGGAMDAAEAAYDVGYESPSQFSRECRRLFGHPPARDIARLRASPELAGMTT
jgi:hypothetical protein